MAIKHEMLRCFCVAVQEGSLLKAANMLGRTPSAVSMMLKQLEDHIGASLFETARKSRLTPLGEMVYTEAKRELDHFDRTVATIQGLSTATEGSVRLVVIPSVATGILPDIIRQFVREYPRVRIDMRDMDSVSVEHELEKERADIGFASVSHESSLERRKLFTDSFGLVCSKHDPLAVTDKAISWVDIIERPFIANGLCRLVNDVDFRPILKASSLSVPNTASLLALVRAQVGVTLLPRVALPPDYGGVVFRPLADCKARRDVYIVSQPQRMLTPAARAFLTIVDAYRIDPRTGDSDKVDRT